MRKVFLNINNLKKDEIDEEVVRVKALLINSKNELLLGYSYNCYQFPGGHREGNELVQDTIKREVKEETGINIELEDIEPFMEIKYFAKNYFNTGKNRCNRLYYFVINTDSEINLNETNYTKQEKEGNYELKYVSLNDVEETLIDNCNKYPETRTVTYEMLQVLSEFKNSINM